MNNSRMLAVVMVNQQLGTPVAGSNFFSTLANIHGSEGNEAFVKGFWTQYIVTVLEDRLRKWLTSLIRNVKFGQALLPELTVLIGHWLTYPLKLIRARLIQQNNGVKYHGIFDCFVKMRQDEGALATWSGVNLDTARVAVGLLFNNWAHDAITVRCLKYLNPYWALFAGLPAELILGLITFPLSTIVTKLQGQIPHAPKRIRPDVQSHSFTEVVAKTYEKHGLLGFWNGYFGFCLRSMTQVTVITLLTHAVWKIGFLRRFLLKTN